MRRGRGCGGEGRESCGGGCDVVEEGATHWRRARQQQRHRRVCVMVEVVEGAFVEVEGA